MPLSQVEGSLCSHLTGEGSAGQASLLPRLGSGGPCRARPSPLVLGQGLTERPSCRGQRERPVAECHHTGPIPVAWPRGPLLAQPLASTLCPGLAAGGGDRSSRQQGTACWGFCCRLGLGEGVSGRACPAPHGNSCTVLPRVLGAASEDGVPVPCCSWVQAPSVGSSLRACVGSHPGHEGVLWRACVPRSPGPPRVPAAGRLAPSVSRLRSSHVLSAAAQQGRRSKCPRVFFLSWSGVISCRRSGENGSPTRGTAAGCAAGRLGPQAPPLRAPRLLAPLMLPCGPGCPVMGCGTGPVHVFWGVKLHHVPVLPQSSNLVSGGLPLAA